MTEMRTEKKELPTRFWVRRASRATRRPIILKRWSMPGHCRRTGAASAGNGSTRNGGDVHAKPIANHCATSIDRGGGRAAEVLAIGGEQDEVHSEICHLGLRSRGRRLPRTSLVLLYRALSGRCGVAIGALRLLFGEAHHHRPAPHPAHSGGRARPTVRRAGSAAQRRLRRRVAPARSPCWVWRPWLSLLAPAGMPTRNRPKRSTSRASISRRATRRDPRTW